MKESRKCKGLVGKGSSELLANELIFRSGRKRMFSKVDEFRRKICIT